MPGEMNTNLKVEDLQMDVMITETYPGKGVLAALLMRSFRYGTGEITWKYSCGSTCDRKSGKKELHVLSEE